MVDCQIHTSGVVSPEILTAFETTPRELFVPDGFKTIAYMDENIPLGHGRFMLAPTTHARLIQAAGITPQSNVLDIGGGTGYSAALLSSLAKKVTALEDRDYFSNTAHALWQNLGISNVEPATGPLPKGFPTDGPYDVILINGAASKIPAALSEQLTPTGRIVAIVKHPGSSMGKATIFSHSGSQALGSHILFDASGEYLPGFEAGPGFEF